jgi:hypothetical protein
MATVDATVVRAHQYSAGPRARRLPTRVGHVRNRRSGAPARAMG